MARPAAGALLDPAFDDDDPLRRHDDADAYGSGSEREYDQDELDELDELDVDRFDGHLSQHDALGEQLGPGFGSMLDSLSHKDDLLVERFHHDDHSYFENEDEAASTAVADITATTPSRRPRSMIHHRTPSRSHADGIAADDGHLSLAFELASARSPARAPNDRDLMRQLGFDDDQDEDDHDDHDLHEEDTLESDHAFDEIDEDHRALQAEAEGVVSLSTSTEHPSSPSRQSTLGRRSIILRSNHMSRASVASFSPFVDSHPDPIDIEAVLAEATHQVSESNQIVTTFLNHLKRHTTNDATVEHDESEDVWVDRQPLMEALANTFLRSLQERAKTCQSQLRELAEIERAFSKNDVGWQATLAQLDEVSWSSDEDDEEDENEDGQQEGDHLEAGERDQTLASIPTTIPHSEPNDSILSDRHPPSDMARNDPCPHHVQRLQPRPSPITTAIEELAKLRNVTVSLADSLSSIHEMTQVNHAAAGDTSRKLRALRAQATTLRDELNAWERAEEFVAHREQERANGVTSWSQRERIASLAREEMRVAERLLNEGWEKAQRMLVVR
ncbi:BQ2448_1919 [Microbotryum intermedium]|uniref:BQ2448_1919 protein n=1 Tax=Microbotryum intermedium TaxID=269621 RepID=A0A238FBF6_9BASI|nr:BQ2448_1919 [Microbotryum intermedium]